MAPLKAASTNRLKGSAPALGNSGSVSQWTPSQNNVARQLMMYYMEAGWTKAGAAGVIGNQMQESGLNPSEQGGYLSQWLGPRLTSLQSFASSLGLPITSVEAQAKFTVHEIKSTYPSLDKALSTAKNPGTAALAVSSQYERPAGWAARNDLRQKYAAQAYGGITGANGTNSGSGGNPGGSAPSSILDLLTSPVDTLGGWLASIAVTVIKDTAVAIGDTIIVPFFHWQERTIMGYSLQMFSSNQSWPMLPWTATFWGLGYWLLFTDPNSGNLKPAPVRNSRAGHHVRTLQSIPARRSLIAPKKVSERTPTKPEPVSSTATIKQVTTMRTNRPHTVRVTGGTSNAGNDRSAGQQQPSETPIKSTGTVKRRTRTLPHAVDRTRIGSLQDRARHPDGSKRKGGSRRTQS